MYWDRISECIGVSIGTHWEYRCVLGLYLHVSLFHTYQIPTQYLPKHTSVYSCTCQHVSYVLWYVLSLYWHVLMLNTYTQDTQDEPNTCQYKWHELKTYLLVIITFNTHNQYQYRGDVLACIGMYWLYWCERFLGCLLMCACVINLFSINPSTFFMLLYTLSIPTNTARCAGRCFIHTH